MLVRDFLSLFFFFFFSSRRRHTRCSRDWSSDVCSSDLKKCKPGDAVNARTTEAIKSEGKMVIPKGSKLVGHVTEASARGNGETESALGIVFDKAILKNGQEIPLNVAIQALASAQGGPSMAGDEMDTMGGLSGSAAGSGMAAGGKWSRWGKSYAGGHAR